VIPADVLPECPQCGLAIRQAERVGCSAVVEPCGHVIAAEVLCPAHAEAELGRELVADGGVSRVDRVARNKAAGVEAECHVAAAIPALGLVSDDVAETYDAIATSAIFPSDTLPMVGICVVARGTRVEIKSTIRRLSDGNRGRFYLRPAQHTALVEAGGVYVFAVVDTDRRPLALKIVPATTFESILPSWRSGGEGRSDYQQLAWSNLFPTSAVERGRSA